MNPSPFSHFLATVVFLVSAFGLPAQLVREQATEVNLPAYPPEEGYSFVDALPGVTFDRPVGIYTPPGDSQRLFILELSGRIFVIPDASNPTKELFLDLSGDTVYHPSNIEEGLLGLAFHPEFQDNGQFFVFRSQKFPGPGGSNQTHQVLSKFQVKTDDENRGDPESEVVVLKQLDGSNQHNGGDLKFGPDGYLYISMGDLSPTPVDASSNPQAIDRGHFGGILRIDVDKNPANLQPNPHHSVTENYLIPADNPFVGFTEYQGIGVDAERLRSEFFAIGFRNPWKMTFDPSNGGLIVADVGGALWEEICVVKAGENHGWPYIEGEKVRISPPSGFEGTSPLVAYSHNQEDIFEGKCVIGGVFYSGDQYPGLEGAYIYGDYVTGYIWHLFPEDDGLVRRPSGWLAYLRRVSSFGIDPIDESILASDFDSGKIKRLVYHTLETAAPFPQTLSETNLFADLEVLAPSKGVVPYEINHTFWSDFAIKKRWFGIPSLTLQFGFDTTQPWSAPSSTFWVKHFDLPLSEVDPTQTRRLETRVIVKQDEGAYGVTYKWNDEQTEAFLVAPEGEVESYDYETVNGDRIPRKWIYPARGDCMRCHNHSTTRALGFSTPQLNRDIDYGSGKVYQLEALAGAGYIAQPPNRKQLDRFVETEEEDQGLIHRAKSYLATNCSFCHNPGEIFSWDARSHTPINSMRVLHRNVLPNRATKSWLYSRLNRRDKLKMPPLASNVVDDDGARLISRWIDGFATGAWTESVGAGSHPWSGASKEPSGAVYVSGNGEGLTDEGRDFTSLNHSLLGRYGSIRSRLASQSADSAVGRAGVMIESGPEVTAMLSIGQGGELTLRYRTSSTASLDEVVYPGQFEMPIYLALSVEGEKVTPSWSTDDETWTDLEPLSGFEFEGVPRAHLVAFNPGYTPINTGVFEDVLLLSAEVNFAQSVVYRAQDVIRFDLRVGGVGGLEIDQVTFSLGGQLLKTVTEEPFVLEWVSQSGVDLSMSADVIMADGRHLKVASALFSVDGVDPYAAVAEGDHPEPSVQWPTLIGQTGYLLPGVPVIKPPLSSLEQVSGAVEVMPETITEEARLSDPSGEGAIDQMFVKEGEIRFDLSLSDGFFYDFNLYLVNTETDLRDFKVVVESLEGEVLTDLMVMDLDKGRFLSMVIRGEVIIRIQAVDDGKVSVGGIFLDKILNEAPEVGLVRVGSRKDVAPSGPLVEAVVSDSDGTIDRVEFLLNGELRGSVTEAPYLWDFAPLSSGEYQVEAVGYDDGGRRGVSEALQFTLRTPISGAYFVEEDRLTSGDWKGTFGEKGSYITGQEAVIPPETGWSELGLVRTEPEDYDLFADVFPETPSGGARSTEYWTLDETAHLELDFRDGKAKVVSFYLMGDGPSSAVLIRAIDPANGEILSAKVSSSIEGGVFQSWSVIGRVRFEFVPQSGATIPALAAVFFDAPQVAGVEVSVATNVGNHPISSVGGGITRVSLEGIPHEDVAEIHLFDGLTRIGSSIFWSEGFRWFPEVPEAHCVFARIYTTTGLILDSDPEIFESIAPQVTPKVIFVGADTATKGGWMGLYGAEGYTIPNVDEKSPSFGDYESSARTHTWAPSTSDLRAIQVPSGGRRASCFVGTSAINGHFSFNDGKWHNVSLYFMDWDSTTRGVEVSFHYPDTGELILKKSLTSYQGGIYLNWKIRGAVDLKVTKISGSNALLNGVFFNPTSSYDQWISNAYFDSIEGPQIPFHMMAPLNDPDSDNIPNIIEYKFMRDPLFNEGSPLYYVGPGVESGVEVSWLENPLARDVQMDLQESTLLKDWFLSPKEMIVDDVSLDSLGRKYVVPDDERQRFFRFMLKHE